MSPESIRDLKLLDPACGTGHFLVVAVDYFFRLYKEEEKHRIKTGKLQRLDPNWTDNSIVERIIGHNLYGLDIDPKAIQVAIAALFLKGKSISNEITPKHFNLVSSQLHIPDRSDESVVQFKKNVYQQTGIAKKHTENFLDILKIRLSWNTFTGQHTPR